MPDISTTAPGFSFKIILFPSHVKHHPRPIKLWDSPSRQDISVHGSSAAQSPLSPSIWDTTIVQKPGADSTQKELNHLPWPCCPSGLTEQRAGTQWLSVAQSSIWQQVHQGSEHAEQNCRPTTVLLQPDLCFMAFSFIFVICLFKGSLMAQAVREDRRKQLEEIRMCEKTIRSSQGKGSEGRRDMEKTRTVVGGRLKLMQRMHQWESCCTDHKTQAGNTKLVFELDFKMKQKARSLVLTAVPLRLSLKVLYLNSVTGIT